MDDESCISPTDASQFLYNRNQAQGHLGNFQIEEEVEDEPESSTGRRNSVVNVRERIIIACLIAHLPFQTFQMPDLDDESRVKLLSVLDEVRNIVGDSTPDQQIVDTIMKFNYDMAASLNHILNSTAEAAANAAPKKLNPLLDKEKGKSRENFIPSIN